MLAGKAHVLACVCVFENSKVESLHTLSVSRVNSFNIVDVTGLQEKLHISTHYDCFSCLSRKHKQDFIVHALYVL